MSQTSRSRILAAHRHRRGLAIAIAQDQFVSLAHGKPEPGLERIILSGTLKFDVARAREYAEELKALEVDHAAFVKWTRERGKGPENREPGAFDSNWSWAPVRGEPDTPRDGYSAAVKHRGGWPGKLAREWPGDRRAPMGRSLARLGRRLLDALEGQHDECQGRACVLLRKMLSTAGIDPVCQRDRDCPDCHGTGHNLAGVLPPIEVTPQLRRAREHHVYGTRESWLDSIPRESWLDSIPRESWLDSIPHHSLSGPDATRAVPRGEHLTDFCLDFAPWPGSNAGDLDTYAWRCAPKWLRCRLTHAQQRRERGRAAAQRVASSNAAQHAG